MGRLSILWDIYDEKTNLAFFQKLCARLCAGGGMYRIFGWRCGIPLTDDPKALFTFLLDFQEIKQNYFRPIEDKTLFAGASQGMFASVGDPYTMVLSGDAYESFMQSATGEYGGIGVVMGQERTAGRLF